MKKLKTLLFITYEKYNEIEMIKHIEYLFPICRSITGEGLRKTLQYFESFLLIIKELNLKLVKKFLTGKFPMNGI